MITHQLLSHDKVLKERVIQLLGSDVAPKGVIDRKKVAAIVFKDDECLSQLEKIIHPPLLEKLLARMEQIDKEGHYKALVVEIPLLFELGWETHFDMTIAVMAPKDLCKERCSFNDYDNRTSRQLTAAQKAKKADYVLHNDGDMEKLQTNINTLLGDRIQI